MHVSTLIIGSGFAGRSVASRLAPGSYAIVERGEARSFGEMRARHAANHDPKAPFWENARHAYKSDLPWNATYRLSSRCFSQYEFIEGGASNRWTGRALPLSPTVFEPAQDDRPQWPFRFGTLAPYYREAERILDLSVDPSLVGKSGATNVFRGASYWKSLLQPYFKGVTIRSEAKNTGAHTELKGQCCGAGDCEACPVDAKSRPANTFGPDSATLFGHYVRELVFDGGRAVAAICETTKGSIRITFDRVVVAAHAIESVALLTRSKLPGSVPVKNLGRNYHDHAVAEILIRLPVPVLHRNMDSKAAAQLDDLTGEYHGLEAIVYVEAEGPKPTDLATALLSDPTTLIEHGEQAAIASLRRLLKVTVLLEMPPELGLFVDTSGAHPVVRDDTYVRVVPTYDRIISELAKKLEDSGAEVVAVEPHYRHSYGCHHIMGTLAMSPTPSGVVDADNLLRGTENCYINGSALIPRAGGHNPTLTVVALGLRLGDALARN